MLLLGDSKEEDILVLAPTHSDAEELYYQLDDGLKSKSKVTTKDIVYNKIIITTFHSSKGLEYKICILVNADKIYDKKLLHVGMTRASQRLCIHAADYEPQSFARQLKNREFEDKNIIDIINHTLSDYI
jgi:superfamily I DNA/RNA helicase